MPSETVQRSRWSSTGGIPPETAAALAPDHRQDADDIPVYGVGANEVGGQLSTAEQPDVLAGPVLQRQNFRHHIGGEKDNPASGARGVREATRNRFSAASGRELRQSS